MPIILIVDDHSAIRRLLCITLGREHKVIEAENGVAALDAIRLHHPKAVLLDVMMPGEMDGLQVLDAIKGNPQTKGVLVAMVTARGQVADGDEARAHGADAYFIKPFSPLQVVTWLRSNLK
jgi:CheY-like chemotaxis protein